MARQLTKAFFDWRRKPIKQTWKFTWEAWTWWKRKKRQLRRWLTEVVFVRSGMVLICISAGSSECTFVYLSGASPEYPLSPVDNICLSYGSDLDNFTWSHSAADIQFVFCMEMAVWRKWRALRMQPRYDPGASNAWRGPRQWQVERLLGWSAEYELASEC